MSTATSFILGSNALRQHLQPPDTATVLPSVWCDSLPVLSVHLANAHVTPLCVTLIDNQIPYNRLANDVIEVLYFLRSQAESRYVPCILITTEQHRLQDGFRAGANSALVIDPHDYELGTLLLQIDHFWRNLVRTPSR